jgi:hypothetical protein
MRQESSERHSGKRGASGEENGGEKGGGKGVSKCKRKGHRAIDDLSSETGCSGIIEKPKNA